MLTLYSYFRSSCSYRVRIALLLKNLPHTVHPVHLLKDGGEQNQPSYLKLNPIGEVPFLKISENEGVGQSMAILQYLDATHPEPRLFPKDPYAHARVLQICEMINASIQPLQNVRVHQYLKSEFHCNDEQIKKWTVHWITRGLSAVERTLEKTAGTYAFGNTITCADLCLVPQVVSSKRFGADISSYPVIQRVFQQCRQQNAFVASDPDHQVDTPASP